MIRLGVLDQSIATTGREQGAAIRDTVSMARHCEALGYHRFWVSEHHNHPTIVGTAPEILLAAIAVSTQSIRIGSAGVMLPHYAPFKVAEQFRVLEALAPGRVDIGLGRAPGSDRHTAFALNPMANERPEQFPGDVRDLHAWLGNLELPSEHPFRMLKAQPTGETAPEMWMLGSSDYGAQVAAHFGLPYSFAWFFTDGRGGQHALDLYRELYKPSDRHPEPHAGICVWALAADTEQEAQHHFTSRARWRVFRDRGTFLPFGPPEDPDAPPLTPADEARIEQLREDEFVGTASSVAARITALAQQLGVQEVAIVTWAHDETARRRSYELLAKEFALVGSQ